MQILYPQFKSGYLLKLELVANDSFLNRTLNIQIPALFPLKSARNDLIKLCVEIDFQLVAYVIILERFTNRAYELYSFTTLRQMKKIASFTHIAKLFEYLNSVAQSE